MSGKLDQSLDDILKDRRTPRNNRPRRRGPNGAKGPAPAAPPAGGVKKFVKPVKPAGKVNVPTGPSANSGPSKAIVSNLPMDVTEPQVKEYFSRSIGPVQKAWLTYGPDGKSRGSATILFSKTTSAADAARQLNGVKVDGRPMKIEVVVNAKDAPPAVPAKSLTERISGPKPAAKPQPKPATVTKKSTVNKAAKKIKRGRNAGRGKPKTMEELDAEMKDYFTEPNATGGTDGDTPMVTNGGAVQPVANGGDTGMEDEIL